ncbi:MAG: hypothetical protein JSV80_04955, partial [Acidobacteriota bacterium]
MARLDLFLVCGLAGLACAALPAGSTPGSAGPAGAQIVLETRLPAPPLRAPLVVERDGSRRSVL